MLRWLCLFTCLYLLCSAALAHAQAVTLRPRIEASGPAVTMGDVFDGAGEASGRAIAPAPPPGQVSNLSMALVSAAASAAGLDFDAPAGVREVRVVRPGGMRATLGPASFAPRDANTAVRRGESVLLLFEAPGMRITTNARAMDDGAVGDVIRLVNVSSNRTVNAVVTGPGQASAQ